MNKVLKNTLYRSKVDSSLVVTTDYTGYTSICYRDLHNSKTIKHMDRIKFEETYNFVQTEYDFYLVTLGKLWTPTIVELDYEPTSGKYLFMDVEDVYPLDEITTATYIGSARFCSGQLVSFQRTKGQLTLETIKRKMNKLNSEKENVC